MAKVIVAMSGGVDSTVVAALLLKQGFEVQGLTLRLWHASRDDSAAPEAASQVAAQLGIPSVVVGLPMRSKHAPLEMVDLADLAGALRLIQIALADPYALP